MDSTRSPGTNLTHRSAVVLLAASAVLWSLAGVLLKSVSWNPMAIAGARSAIASLVLLAAVRRPRFTWSPAEVGGAVALAATVILFVLANKLTTAANAIALQYTSPVYVALFGAWFLGERASWFDWLVILVVLGGMGLFFADGLAAAGLRGNICAILSGVSFAAMILLLRKQKDASPLESVLLGNVITAVVGIPFMLGGPGGLPDGRSLAVIVALGVFQLGVPYALYAAAIKHVTALEASIIPIVEPILNPVWVYLVTGERPGRWSLVGGLIVITAVGLRSTLATVGRTPAPKRPGLRKVGPGHRLIVEEARTGSRRDHPS